MFDRAIGIAGLAIAIIAVVAPFRWREMRRWITDVGLSVGFLLIGIAIAPIAYEHRSPEPPPTPVTQGTPNDRYGRAVTELAAVAQMTRELSSFRNQSNRYIEACAETLKSFGGGKIAESEIQALQEWGISIQNYVNTAIGDSIDLRRHPNFDRFPNREVSGEKSIADDTIRTEYRKFYDECDTAKLTLNTLESHFQNEINKHVSEAVHSTEK